MKSKRANRVQNNLLIMSLSTLLVVLVILFFNFQLRIIEGDTKNFCISFYNDSKTKEDSSCRIIIDDSVVYEIGKISESKDIHLVLKNGKHKVEVSDLKDKYYIQDSIFVKNYPEENGLFISFEYNPSYEEYLPIFKKQYFDRLIEKHNLESRVDEKASVFEQINQKIDIDYLKRTDYKPIKRNFKTTFYDEPIIIL